MKEHFWIIVGMSAVGLSSCAAPIMSQQSRFPLRVHAVTFKNETGERINNMRIVAGKYDANCGVVAKDGAATLSYTVRRQRPYLDANTAISWTDEADAAHSVRIDLAEEMVLRQDCAIIFHIQPNEVVQVEASRE